MRAARWRYSPCRSARTRPDFFSRRQLEHVRHTAGVRTATTAGFDALFPAFATKQLDHRKQLDETIIRVGELALAQKSVTVGRGPGSPQRAC